MPLKGPSYGKDSENVRLMFFRVHFRAEERSSRNLRAVEEMKTDNLFRSHEISGLPYALLHQVRHWCICLRSQRNLGVSLVILLAFLLLESICMYDTLLFERVMGDICNPIQYN